MSGREKEESKSFVHLSAHPVIIGYFSTEPSSETVYSRPWGWLPRMSGAISETWAKCFWSITKQW